MITVAGVVFDHDRRPRYFEPVHVACAAQLHGRSVESIRAGRVSRHLRLLLGGAWTIRGGDEGAFVPSLAVLIGWSRAGRDAVLIYFIHHIAVSIRRRRSCQCRGGNARSRRPTVSEGNWRRTRAAPAGAPVGGAQLASRACEADRLHPGHRCSRAAPIGKRGAARRADGSRHWRVCRRGAPIASVLASGVLDEEDGANSLALSVDRQRTFDQDAAFGIRQIVDVALKALSPASTTRPLP